MYKSPDIFNSRVVYNDTAKAVIADIRKVLKGTGCSLRVRGRNANRYQFADNYGGTSGYSHKQLRQDLPIQYATHVALYLRRRWYDQTGNPIPEKFSYDYLKGAIYAVVKLRALRGCKLETV